MTTLTSTGAVSLTSATNWSPAQIPADGDTIIVGHALTLDADKTFESVTLNTGASITISGTSRTVTATNGWTLTFAYTNLIATLTTGQDVTLYGQWIWTVTGSQHCNGLFSSTGGNLTLSTVGDDNTAVLFEGSTRTTGNLTIASSWTGGTLTTVGKMNFSQYGGNSILFAISGGVWNHDSVGINDFYSTQTFAAPNFQIATVSGSAQLLWSGSLVVSSVRASSGMFQFTSSANHVLNAGVGGRFELTNVSATSWTALFTQVGGSGTVEVIGSCYTVVGAWVCYSGFGTFVWKSQSVTVPSGKECTLRTSGAALDLTDLIVANNSKFIVSRFYMAGSVIVAGLAITNQSADAFAAGVGTTALDDKIVVLESDPPTLPAVEDVASGTSYGYTGIELTGTGLILDPAVLAAGVGTALNNISATALARFVTVDTGETEAAAGSVASFGGGGGGSTDLTPVLDKLPTSGRALSDSAYTAPDNTGISTLLGRLSATRAGYLDNLPNLDAAISSLNNLSALANLYGSPLLEIPDSGSVDYAFTLVVRDNEGKLKDLDASPTITAANASGTDRSANLSAVSNPSTGRYTFTYTVASTAVLESLRITCSGTISAEARYVEWIGAVVNYDTVTTLAAIKAKTDNLPADPADQSDVEAAITSAVSTIQGTQASNAQTGAAAALTADSSLSTLLTRIAGTIRTAADDGAAEATQTAAIQGTQQSNAQAGANAAIVANHLDHLLASAYDPASKPGNASGLLNALVENDGGVPRYTANALEQAPAGGGGGSSTDYLLLQSTTIATLASQTIFTLAEGSPDNDAYNGCILIIEDQATAEQKAKCIVNDYVGSSKTVTIRTPPAFTVATGDAVYIYAIGEGDMLDAPRVVSLASATWTAGTITGFPASLNIGDSYVDEVNRAITIYYRDEDENPVTAVGSKNLTDADFISELVISQGNRSGRIKILTGWTVASEGYLLIEIPQSETRRLAEGDATLQLTFKWDGGFEVVVATQTIQMIKKY